MRSRFVLAALAALAALPVRAQEIAPPSGGCHYEIALADPEARMLDVALACAGDGPFALSTYRFLTDAQIRDFRAASGSRLDKGQGAWVLKGAGGFARAAYRFDVDALARSTNSPALGQRVGGSVVATARSFLLLPEGGKTRMTLTLRFTTPPGAQVLTGLAAAGEAQRLDTADLDLIGFMAMGRLDVLSVPVEARGGAGTLTVAMLDGKRAIGNDEIQRWIGASAARIGAYFGGFPVKQALIVLEPVPNLRYLRRGLVMGGGGATMLLRIGAETQAEDLFRQWMLMHELVHFAAPFIEGHTWLMEGMAVYVETRLRVAAGWFPEDQAWRGFMKNVRQGMPAMQRTGLAAARGIGPVYWGGTLFMLLADAEIIEKSQGTKSLADCFQAVLDQGGDAAQRWSLERFIAVCDAATGFGTMRRLAAAHTWKGSDLHLAPLWAKLGVQLTEYEAGVKYDDTAPLAWVRKKIMQGP
ncbi:MAG TPA: hypothetical protein VIF14_08175 [Alphaproteobacteria bacterium]|jgi:hypothetical protein